MAAYPFFFFNDTATTEIYTLSLHDALPIFQARMGAPPARPNSSIWDRVGIDDFDPVRSEEHTSELQSRSDLVCRLLLEKKNIATFPPLRRRVPTVDSRARCLHAPFILQPDR